MLVCATQREVLLVANLLEQGFSLGFGRMPPLARNIFVTYFPPSSLYACAELGLAFDSLPDVLSWEISG
jgi:hypothetical protein